MNTIQGSFGWSNAELGPAMNEAEKIVSRGASNIQNKFASIFKRSPNMRAERAISGSLQAFASGDIASGIEAITGRMTGLGLVAGVAIGAGVAIFVKFHQEIMESNAAAKSLASTLAFAGNLRGPEALAQRFTEVSKGVDTLIEKSEKLGPTVSRFFNQPGSLFATPSQKPGETQSLINSGLKEEGNLLVKNAAMTERQFELKKSAVTAGETQAKIAKAYQDMTIKQGAIDERLGKFKADAVEKAKTLSDAQRAIIFKDTIPNAEKAAASEKETVRREGAFELAQDKKKLDIQNQGLAIEERMQTLIRKGLKPEDQPKVRTGLELKSLDKQIAGETNPDTLRRLKIARSQKQDELHSFASPEGSGNPFQQGTISARDFERSQDSANFNSQFASFGLSQGQKDLKGAGAPNAEVVAAVKEVKDAIVNTMKDYWGSGGAK